MEITFVPGLSEAAEDLVKQRKNRAVSCFYFFTNKKRKRKKEREGKEKEKK